jgi:hypothetical protein
MPRSIQGFKPKALSQDRRFYSDDDIEAIITAAGRTVRARVPGLRWRQALSERLEVVAHNYTQCSQFQSEPTAKQIADAMADIETAAAKLIAALHVPEAMDEDPIASMPVALRSGALQAQAALEAGQLGGVGLLRDSVHGVYRLQRWSRNVQARLRTAPHEVSVSVHDGTVSWNLVTEVPGLRVGFIPQPNRRRAQSAVSAMKICIACLEIWRGFGRRCLSAGSRHP